MHGAPCYVSEVPVAELKFFRQVNGRGQFGWVHVVAGDGSGQVTVDLDPGVEITSNGFVLSLENPEAVEWAQGAVEGCGEALELVQQEGLGPGGWARVLSIRGATVDTCRESVRIAALMTTWKALTGGLYPLTMAFRDDRWDVQRT